MHHKFNDFIKEGGLEIFAMWGSLIFLLHDDTCGDTTNNHLNSCTDNLYEFIII